MYKINIGQQVLILTDNSSAAAVAAAYKKPLIVDYYGQKNYISRYIDTLEKNSPKQDAIILKSNNLEGLWQDFNMLYKIIEAAGGLVFNDKKEVLAIYRKGYWDLPKGKIDKGESPEQAALREVQEETGIFQLSLGDLLLETYHTYLDPYKNRKVLKKTYWYQMQTIEEKLTAQTEEDIEIACWLSKTALQSKTPIYQNILDVIASCR